MPEKMTDDRTVGRPQSSIEGAEHSPKRLRNEQSRRTASHYARFGVAGVALTSALVAGVALSMAPTNDSYAYVNDSSIAEAVGDKPTITVNLEHSLGAEGKQPQPGEDFTYTGKIDFTVPEGTPNKVTLSVTQDEKAPFKTAPALSDLQFPGGNVTGVTQDPKDSNTWVYTIENVTKGGTATFTKQATLNADVKPGMVIVASASMNMTPSGDTALEQMDQKLIWDAGQCSGVAYFKYKIPEGDLGAWLADIKFADYSDSKDAVLDPLPADAAALADVNLEKRNGFRVSNPGTTDGALTNEFLTDAVTRNDDSTKPLFGTDPKLANGRFLDSINWPYNPETWTGTQWVKSGTVFELRRGFKLANCVPIRTSTNLSAKRDIIGVQISQARKLPPAQENANDSFVIRDKNGELPPPPPWCSDIYINASNAVDVSKRIDLWDSKKQEMTTLRDGLSIPPYSGTIAISPKVENTIWYATAPKGQPARLYTASSENGGKGVLTNFPPYPSSTARIISLGFDPDGILWAFHGSGYLYSLDVSNPAAQWERHGTLGNPLVTTNLPLDITFNANGDLVTVANSTTGSNALKQKVVLTYSHDDLINTTGQTVIQPIKQAILTSSDSIKEFNGVAVGADGNLYLGTRDQGYLYTASPDGGKITRVPNVTVSPGIADMGSCSYIPAGEQPAPDAPKFLVQKRAIDPVTGAPATAGGTTINNAKINDDGSVKVSYLVTVANSGTAAGNPGNVTDTVSAPAGFTITDVAVDGKSQGKNATFTLAPGELASGALKSYQVTVSLQADSLEAVKNIAGECNTQGEGTPGGGFFNRVAMENDSDGPDNNDACIPVKPRPVAHLKLVKQIVDQDGRVINSQVPNDLGHFSLAASGYTAENMNPLGGATGQAKPNEGVAVDQDVFAGRYALSETITEPGGVAGYYQSGNWTCEGGNGKMVNANTVDVPENGSVTCTIQNTRLPRFHIEKLAGTPDPALGNPHVGEPVVLKNGAGELVYRMNVVNDSNFAGNTGVVRDNFEVPAGLVMDDAKAVKVVFSGEGSRVGGKDTYTAEELKAGAVLADSVKNLGPQAKATFTITIPVKADTSKVEGSDLTKFEQAQDALGQCETQTATVNREEVKLANPNDKAAVNNANIDLENTQYAENDAVWYRDNFACIPVVENKWSVEKYSQFDPSAEGADEANNGGDGFVKTPGTTGTGVTLTPADNGDLTATVKYRVRATNRGKNASVQPAISDTITLPQGFVITDAKFGPADGALAPVSGIAGNTVTFEIPAGSDKVNGGEHMDYLVEVSGKITAEDAAKLAWTASDSEAVGVGECRTENGGTPGTGFFNHVSMEGDEGTDGNNDACTPVKPQLGIALVEKTDAGGSRLSGAKFALYKAADSNAKPLAMGEVVKAELDELTEANAGQIPADALTDTDGDGKYMGRFVTPTLSAGTVYFLVETKSPTKDFSLLPEPYVFKVDGAGNLIALDAKTGEALGKADDGTFLTAAAKVTVRDPRTGELPKAGGNGRMPLAIGGALIVLLSAAGMFRTVRRS
ncbi:hypothetical protein BK816_00560 [Boudabousia tangfeifanii]|uniref:Uncharacterized protein n=1 Tax=Boudabousia tangfeifanii TaxID=1912795 RepID=A0A1D9MID7_9ACTO|nr:SpaA isopeptide-forming pilin-related protein [Boudabousia tangfeifanii]AOZ71968.1 hypothetical protein BK816_00560 [Boudabousia tangfeifanii]